jgi:hypothetical protein
MTPVILTIPIPESKNDTKAILEGKKNNEIDRKLFQYLLWGQTTNPARFRYLKEFIAWAEPLGYPAEPCREVWFELRNMYRPLYGEPKF